MGVLDSLIGRTKVAYFIRHAYTRQVTVSNNWTRIDALFVIWEIYVVEI